MTFVNFLTWLIRADNLTAVSTLVIAVFTIALAFATYFQYRLTRKAIDLARQEFVASHRPRIILKDVHLTADEVHYMLVNVGDTDATIVESWILAEFIEHGNRLRPLRSPGHDDLGRLVIAAGESRDLTYLLPGEISFAIKFPDSRKIAIEGKPAVFGERYFVGVIVYEDGLRVRRRSVFRRKWDDASLTFIRLTPEQERDHEYAD
jgi:hypothetical protein